jgi:hypothetical protein
MAARPENIATRLTTNRLFARRAKAGKTPDGVDFAGNEFAGFPGEVRIEILISRSVYDDTFLRRAGPAGGFHSAFLRESVCVAWP